jgi:hypothetical protein
MSSCVMLIRVHDVLTLPLPGVTFPSKRKGKQAQKDL